MTFEEEFPSLKKRGYSAWSRDIFGNARLISDEESRFITTLYSKKKELD